MAFPFLLEENFEGGTKGAFDASADTDSKLTFPHYSALAAIPGLPAPFRGAYAMMIDLSKGTSDAYVQETGSLDTSAAGTIWLRFYVWFGAPRGRTLTMANNDLFSIFQLWSSTNTVEATVGIQYTTASGYRWFVNETASASGASFLTLIPNKWTCIELKALVDSGVGNDGTLDLIVDGVSATQITGLDQGAITSGILGAVGIDAGTTVGVLLFNDIIADDAQIYPRAQRWPEEMMLTKSGHVFVGRGEIANVTLLSGGSADNVLKVFDTDAAEVNDAQAAAIELRNTAASETVDPAGVPVPLDRGCYVELSGTNPRAMVKICRANGYGSDGAVRGVGARRVARRPAV